MLDFVRFRKTVLATGGKFTKCWFIPKAFEEGFNESYRFNSVGEIKLLLT